MPGGAWCGLARRDITVPATCRAERYKAGEAPAHLQTMHVCMQTLLKTAPHRTAQNSKGKKTRGLAGVGLASGSRTPDGQTYLPAHLGFIEASSLRGGHRRRRLGVFGPFSAVALRLLVRRGRSLPGQGPYGRADPEVRCDGKTEERAFSVRRIGSKEGQRSFIHPFTHPSSIDRFFTPMAANEDSGTLRGEGTEKPNRLSAKP